MVIKRLLSIVSAFIAIFLETFPASAAPEMDIKGKIIDAETGEEVIGAAITIKEQPDRWAMSGLDGSFSMRADAEGSKTLVCSLIGYKDVEVVYADTDSMFIQCKG